MSEGVSMHGFRKGNIPEKVLVDKVGESAVLEKAAEMALQDVYSEILMKKKIEAIGTPKATVTKIAKNNPLGFKFQTAVLPTIQLPEDYRELAARIINPPAGGEEIKVEDKEIDDSIEYLRKMRAKHPVQSPEGIVAGKDSGGEAELPELNDDFAKSVGAFKNISELKDTIKKNLKTEKEFQDKEKRHLGALDAILKNAKMEIPEVLIDGERNKMLLEMKSNIENMGLKWEEYLKHLKKEEEDLVKGWTEDASRRVKYGLLLRHLGKELKIEVSDMEIHDEINKMSQGQGIDQEGLKEYVYGIIRNDKIFKFFEGI